VSNFDEIQQLIEDCTERESRLSDWERQFIDALQVQLHQNRDITAKQEDKLLQIWDRVTTR
jgi:hypothetical protein